MSAVILVPATTPISFWSEAGSFLLMLFFCAAVISVLLYICHLTWPSRDRVH